MSLNRSLAVVSAVARRSCALLCLMTALGGTARAVDLPCPPHCNAPEIDPGAAGSALTLLAGGLVVLRDRIRRK